MGGAIHYLQKLPLLNITPLVTLYHITNGAENVKFAEDFIEFDFSPRSLKMVDSMKTDLLKPIETSYAKLSDDKDPSALQSSHQ